MAILVSVSVIIFFFFFQERVINPPPNSQPGGPGAALSQASTLQPVRPAWQDLPGTEVPAGTARWVLETGKLHHLDKVSAQGEVDAEQVKEKEKQLQNSRLSLLRLITENFQSF